VVSAIGAPPRLLDPDRQLLDHPTRLCLDSLAQGLVRFDATGQIEPGLAERWIVIDDGMTYIFRLREAEWADGSPVAAGQVVRLFQRHVAAASRSPLAPFLTAVDSVVEMTPQVIEIRLHRPRPDLLNLFAQPEMALARRRPSGGTGPFRVMPGGGAPMLRLASDPRRVGADDAAVKHPERDVRLIGERAAKAIARFMARQSDMVSGGTFADWPLLAAAGVAPASIGVDPAAGLFGLAVVSREGFLADGAHRNALAAVIDRAALTTTIRRGWVLAETLLPAQLDSAAPPTVPDWAALPIADRRQNAARMVAEWAQPVRLRVALPAGPGATLLYGRVAADLAGVGITVDRVAEDAPADLRLVDQVAPYDSGRWYLATACQGCSTEAQAALIAARDAMTLADRAQLIAAADAALTQDASFIPLARPLRWSLLTPRLRQWTPNARAWHPLNRLRPIPN
jgi:oligopeptide transport system substrate-binding protein